MVDVGNKEATYRIARASGMIQMQAKTLQLIMNQGHVKGDVLGVARVAGIIATKRTAELIPMCHPLALETVQVDFKPFENDAILIEATVAVTAKTGVEMEALTAVSAAALTVYDMCKSVDRSMTICKIQLEEKSGGRSGHFLRSDACASKG